MQPAGCSGGVALATDTPSAEIIFEVYLPNLCKVRQLLPAKRLH